MKPKDFLCTFHSLIIKMFLRICRLGNAIQLAARAHFLTETIYVWSRVYYQNGSEKLEGTQIHIYCMSTTRHYLQAIPTLIALSGELLKFSFGLACVLK